MNPAERCLDGLFRVSEVGMANNVGERFVDGKNHRVAIRFSESKHRRELAQSVPHDAEHLRIAAQLHFE